MIVFPTLRLWWLPRHIVRAGMWKGRFDRLGSCVRVGHLVAVFSPDNRLVVLDHFLSTDKTHAFSSAIRLCREGFDGVANGAERLTWRFGPGLTLDHHAPGLE